MEEILGIQVEEQTTAEKLNPWYSLWFRPRKTIRQLLDTAYDEKTLHKLVAVAGICSVINSCESKSIGDILGTGYTTMVIVVLMALVLGPIGGYIGLYIESGLISWTGKWIGGQGSDKDIRTAIAWSNVPLIWGLILIVLELILFGNEMFTKATPNIDSNIFLGLLFALFMMADFIIAIWYLCIGIACLAEAQRFSVWRAIANILLPFIVVFGGILLLMSPFLIMGS